MVMALKGQVRSTHYRQSNLKGESHQKLIVFLRDNRLLSKHISHKHHYPKSFRMRKLFHFLSNDRIGTYVSVKIEFTLINRIRLRTFLSLDNQGTRHVPAIAY
ncbi:hypothetical protein CIH95_22345 [Salmonella enterica subsp. enterica serovar Montevideo]|nr:hypothetical protein [Salmonella enterica subsp. enterica serovar Montevideo]